MIALLLLVGCPATVEFPPGDSACPDEIDSASFEPDLDLDLDLPDEGPDRQRVRFDCVVTVR